MSSPFKFLQRRLPRQPSAFLLLVLGITVVLYPFADTIAAIRLLVQALDIAIVIVVVRTLRLHTLWLRSAWLISVPLVLLQCAHLVWPGQFLVQVPMLLIQILFHGYAVVLLLGYVLRDHIITLDELYALACIYVLMALLWASAYALVVLIDPQALFINPSNNLDGVTGWSDIVYFSMTTLTSVGFGEITPVSPAARALAMLQQVVGVLYVAILIARLTGMHGAARGRGGTRSPMCRVAAHRECSAVPAHRVWQRDEKPRTARKEPRDHLGLRTSPRNRMHSVPAPIRAAAQHECATLFRTFLMRAGTCRDR